MHTIAIMNQIIDFGVINFFCSESAKSFIVRSTPPKIKLRLYQPSKLAPHGCKPIEEP